MMESRPYIIPDKRFFIVNSYNEETGVYTYQDKDLAEVKTFFSDVQDKKAYDFLLPSDWQVVKAFETSSSLPSNLATYRTAVRTVANQRIAQINACTTVADLQTLITTPETISNAVDQTLSQNPDGLTVWPTEVN